MGDLAEEIETLEAARSELEEKNRDITAEMAQVKETHGQMAQQAARAKADIDAEKQAAESVRSRLADLTRRLDRDKTVLMETVAQEARFRNIHQNATNTRESLQRRLKRMAEEEAAAEAKITALTRTETEARSIHEEIRQELAELSAEVEDHQVRLREKNDALSQQIRSTQALELERNKAKSRHAALKKMEDNLEWYKDGVRRVIQAAKAGDGRLSARIMGLVADQMVPEPSYETAVEAVLGDALQYLLVQDPDDGLSAIGFLHQSGSGRSGFIPVSALQTAAPRQPPPGEVPRLLDHVRIKEGSEQVLEVLLGHALVVEDLPEALAMHRRTS